VLGPSRLADEASGFPWHSGGDIQDNHGGISRPNPRQIGIFSYDRGEWKIDPDMIRAAAAGRLSSEPLRTRE